MRFRSDEIPIRSRRMPMKTIRLCMAASIAAACAMAMLGAQSAQAQSYKVLYTFTGGKHGAYPSPVIRDAQGNLYGETGGGYGRVFKLSRIDKEAVLYSFRDRADGGYPGGGVIQDAKGNLYGTAADGGGTGCNGLGCGLVFKLSLAGKETVLYSFTGGADGASPFEGVIQDAKGDLYGAAQAGGGTGCTGGCGTVFKLSRTGKEITLHSFPGGVDGVVPIAVTLDAKGNLYGTTYAGGAFDSGTVFKLSPTGKKTVLYNFQGGADGADLFARVIRNAQGNLYGTAGYGGVYGYGTVFKVSGTGKETTLYSFKGGADGANPFAGVIQDDQGNLYGTTGYGGDFLCGGAQGCGVVFKLTKTGKEIVLYTFTGGNDGGTPGALIQDAKGNLYGNTNTGGDLSCGQGSGCGVVFELTP
jgi:uncharacterized repeat protein (TIGR03803 family)